MTVSIYVGDCIEVLRTLPAESVHCVVTSPPYYGLRDYGVNGQVGLEGSPDAYVAKLVEVFREVRRVLHPTGVAFLNLGDSYFGSSMTGGTNSKEGSPKRIGRMFQKSDHASRGQSCDSSGKEVSGYLNRDCLSQNPYDARKDVVYFRTLDIPRYRAPKQFHELCLRILEYMGELTAHVPNVDCSPPQPTQQSFVANLDLVRNEARAAEQLLSSLASMPDESFPQPQDRFHLLGSLWAFRSRLRSLIDDAQEFARKWDGFVAPIYDNQDSACDAFLSVLRSAYKDMVCVYCNVVESWLNLPYVQPHYTTEQPYKPKDLMMIPARVALALQADGWWLRSQIIWHKPNAMPESVTDRPTTDYECVYLLAKEARYFYDADAIREPFNYPDRTYNTNPEEHKTWELRENGNRSTSGLHDGREQYGDPARGRNKRTVWTIPTRPFSSAHFATFPPDLVEPMIKAGTSERGACPECGCQWERVVEKGEPVRVREGSNTSAADSVINANGQIGQSSIFRTGEKVPRVTVDWHPDCDCDAGDPIPAVCLDPFAGAGTTGLVADRLERDAILIELNPSYAEMSARRIYDDAGMFAEVEVRDVE